MFKKGREIQTTNDNTIRHKRFACRLTKARICNTYCVSAKKKAVT